MNSRWFWSFGLVLALGFHTGCGGNGDSKTGPVAEQPNQATQTQAAAAPPKTLTGAQKIAGAWYGVAYLDDEMAEKRYAAMPDDAAKLKLVNLVQTFQTMHVGAHFSPDGTYSLDVEMKLPGAEQSVRQQSAGTWKVVNEADGVIQISLTEKKEDGTEETSVRQYEFVEDNNHFAWVPANISPDLVQCNASVVFERQVDEVTSTPIESEVAEKPAETKDR